MFLAIADISCSDASKPQFIAVARRISLRVKWCWSLTKSFLLVISEFCRSCHCNDTSEWLMNYLRFIACASQPILILSTGFVFSCERRKVLIKKFREPSQAISLLPTIRFSSLLISMRFGFAHLKRRNVSFRLQIASTLLELWNFTIPHREAFFNQEKCFSRAFS